MPEDFVMQRFSLGTEVHDCRDRSDEVGVVHVIGALMEERGLSGWAHSVPVYWVRFDGRLERFRGAKEIGALEAVDPRDRRRDGPE